MVASVENGATWTVPVLAQVVTRLVQRSGVLVTIERTTRPPNASGSAYGAPVVTVHGPYRVLVTERSAAPVVITATAPGDVRRDRGWVLLGGPDVALQASATVIDRFTHPVLGRFRVRELRPVLPYGDAGTPAGLVAELEREG